MASITTDVSTAHKRESGTELLRIVLILMILAHHTTYAGIDLPNLVYWRFLNLFGQVGVSGFILISGYYMATKEVRLRKILSLMCEIWFYSIAISICTYYAGISELTLDFMRYTFFPLTSENWWFATFFVCLMLIMPALNKVANNLSESAFSTMLLGLFFIFIVAPCIADAYQFENHFLIMIFLYLVGAYIRLHPCKYTETKRYSAAILIILLIGTYLAIDLTLREFITGKECVNLLGLRYTIYAIALPVMLASFILTKSKIFLTGELTVLAIVGLALHQPEIGFTWVEYFYKCYSILTILMAVCLLILFKNLKIGCVRPINLLASTAFASYLISMHQELKDYLYQTVISTTDYINSSGLVWYLIVSITSLFLVCFAIDICRQGALKLLSSHIDRAYERLASFIRERIPNIGDYILI